MTAQLEYLPDTLPAPAPTPLVPVSLAPARPPAPAGTAVAPALRTTAAASPSAAAGRAKALARTVGSASSVLWRRVPYTTSIVALMMLIALATGSLWRDVTARPWFDAIAYGLPSFENGHWWTPITGAFLALNPWFYLPMAGGFAILVGFTEWRIGTRRTVYVTVGAHLLALAAAMLLLLTFRDSGWLWAAKISDRLDVGFSAGSLAAIAVASAGMRAPWRLRARVLLCLYVLISFVLGGSLADVLHILAVAVALPVGPLIARCGGRAFAGRPSQREWRLLAVAGLVLITASDWILFLAPSDGPLGATGDPDMNLLGILVNLVVVLLVANGLRKGRRIAWWIAVGFAGLSTALGLMVPVGVVVALISDDPIDVQGVPMFVAGQAAWIAMLLVLLIGRRAFRAPSPRRLRRSLDNRTDAATARDILHRNGGSTLSWMSTWPDNRYFVTDDGASVVAYQVHSRVAIALGDPIGPADLRSSAIADFAADSERLGLIPAFFSATAVTTSAAVDKGWQQLQIAEDTILDLPPLEFRGKSWQDIRTAINRAGKEQISFRLTRLMDEPYSVVAQLRAISEQWVGDKGLPELGFTLGGVDEALDPEVRVGIAVDSTGFIHGVVSWLPVHTGDGLIEGWTLDVMRRRDGAFRPVIEFLIAQSCLAFKAEGAGFVSLSGAPLARGTADPEVRGMPKVLDTLGSVLEPVYGFRSLHAFKAKFKPRYESMHLVYRDEADLPRIGIALAKAYLPETSMGEMLRAARGTH